MTSVARQKKYPSLSQQDHTDTTNGPTGLIAWDPSSRATSVLGKFIGMFKILKEAAEIAPVPFLKGAIGTALVLLQTARVSSTGISRGPYTLIVINLTSDDSIKPRRHAANSFHGE
jgi:hypothetical protein